MRRIVVSSVAVCLLVVPVAFGASSVAEAVPRGDFLLVGSARQPGSVIHLTSSAALQRGAAWYSSQVSVADGFTAQFRFRIQHRQGSGADGIAFLIQNSSSSALGEAGDGMGYAKGDPAGGVATGIANSVAVEFDLYKNHFRGRSDPNCRHISVHTRGVEANSVDEVASIGNTGREKLPPFANRHGRTVTITYVPGQLSVSMDGHVWLVVALDLSTTLSLNDGKAWVGFTASTGGAGETQNIVSFTFTPTP
jgi:hypothetical protein